jgi:Zn-dependent protease with chaperone function
MAGADELAAMGARLAGRAGIHPAPAVVIRPAPPGGRRCLATARLAPPVTIAVTPTAAAALPDWRLEAVVAHELGHVGQDRRRLDRAQLVLGCALVATGLTALAALAGVGPARVAVTVALAVLVAAAAVYLPESKRLEYEADRMGARLIGAGPLADHLDLVAREHHELPTAFHAVVAHPPSRRRAARLRASQ